MKKTIVGLTAVLVILTAGLVNAQEVDSYVGSELASDPMDMAEVAAIVNFLQISQTVPQYFSMPLQLRILPCHSANNDNRYKMLVSRYSCKTSLQ